MNKPGFFDKLKLDMNEGVRIISESIKSGWSSTKSRLVLLTKYALLTIVLSIAYVLISSYTPYAIYTIFIPLGVLLLYFYHEMLQIKVKNKMRFFWNALVIGVIIFIIASLLSYSASQNDSSPLSIISSSMGIFLLVIFLFMPIYVVKAGATPAKALKSSFMFATKNAMKTMFYVFFLIITLSIISSIPALIGATVITPILFSYLAYALFIFIIVYWDTCKKLK